MGTFLQLPAALQEYADQRVWVLWKYKKLKSGKYTKPPYQPNDKKAKPNDPSTWVTFAEALAAYERGGFDGIGICLLNIDLGGFDCDDCRNAEWRAGAGSAAPDRARFNLCRDNAEQDRPSHPRQRHQQRASS
jgi:primase-polymerase (primpol)-like protein